MDTSDHSSLSALFQQLGLAFDDKAIADFIGQHHLSAEAKLPDAAFWTAAQAAFLREAIDDDSDWAEAVDHLDAELRR
jgi:hypothetical protein